MLTVLVVAFGHNEELDASLSGVGHHFPLVVVDNSSLPSIEASTRSAGGIYVPRADNAGFAAGVNVGLRHVEAGSDVLLLNPDAVIDAGAVSVLSRRLHSDPRLAAVAPALIDHESGARQRVMWPFPTPRRMWGLALGGRRLGGRDEFLVGAVLLLRREALDDVGQFDERFFLYAEETDWQRRAVIRGWKLAVEPAAVATHVGGATSSDPFIREVRFHAGTETYIRKWHGSSGWLVYRLAAVVASLLRALPGHRRDESLRRAGVFVRGPRRLAERL